MSSTVGQSARVRALARFYSVLFSRVLMMTGPWTAQLIFQRIALCIAPWIAVAAIAAVDLSDFNDDVMRAMDDANKDLQPYISASNVAAARDSALVLEEGLKWTEEYFSAKPDAPDAVHMAKQSIAINAAVLQALEANNLPRAAERALALSHECKTCHEVYKPLTK